MNYQTQDCDNQCKGGAISSPAARQRSTNLMLLADPVLYAAKAARRDTTRIASGSDGVAGRPSTRVARPGDAASAVIDPKGVFVRRSLTLLPTPS